MLKCSIIYIGGYITELFLKCTLSISESKKNHIAIRVFLQKIDINTRTKIITAILIIACWQRQVASPTSVIHNKVIIVKIHISIYFPAVKLFACEISNDGKCIRTYAQPCW